jgi:peptide/nickel transport system ATP-binding protein
VAQLLDAVRLPPSYANRLPEQLSGGEKQRIAIARAFASNPDLLICDEPVSSLDVSVQASILNLLNDLQVEFGSSLLFISHNLAVVGYLADKIAVIYLGQLMEVADSVDLFEPPYHPYTEALLSAIPLAEPGAEQKQIRLTGEIPSPTDIPSGCPFHTRCPRFLGDICVQQTPPWREDEATGKRYFCHIPADELRANQERVFKMAYKG